VNKKLPSSARDCISRTENALAGADLFFGHGTDNAGAEAQWLVCAVLTQDGAGQITADTLVAPAQQVRIQSLLQRRIRERMPLAYLLREAWFAGHCFYVDERVLVPRSPLAELIENTFQPLLKQNPESILDLCCGSGCIGIACAIAFPDSQVILSDQSPAALAVATINIARFGLQDRVSIRQSDLFAEIPGQFDLIVCNPPYVSLAEYRELPAEYHHEPEPGLVSDGNGLDIPLRVLADGGSHLNAAGMLILETGYTWQALAEALPNVPFLWLDFEHGGEGVCALDREQLRRHFP
jgi:ribosomal protein L3 glutamine methyltransferase